MRLSFTLPLVAFSALALTACTSGAENANFTRAPVAPTDKVIVVEFSDFSCPACKASQSVVAQVKAMPTVHFELRHFPLPIPEHEMSPAAANAYECAAAQGMGDAMGIALFGDQGKFTSDELLNLPVASGISTDPKFNNAAYKVCVTDNQYQTLVDRDAHAARLARLTGTPSFVVNGVVYLGADKMLDAVKKALADTAATPADTPAATPAADTQAAPAATPEK